MSTTKIKIRPHADDQRPAGGGSGVSAAAKDPVSAVTIEYNFRERKTHLRYADKDTQIELELTPDSRSKNRKISIEHLADADDSLIILFQGVAKNVSRNAVSKTQLEITTEDTFQLGQNSG